MDAVSMIALGVVAGLLIIGGHSYCYSIRDTSEELRRLAEAVQKSIDFMQTRVDGFAVRMKALEDRVERLEGLLYKPLNREELLFSGAVMDCANGERMLEEMFEELNRHFDEEGGFTATIMEFVPVVRCKDCKYFDMSNPHSTGMPNFYKCKRLAAVWMEPDAFCSYGERKDGDDERDNG